jgi:hypothetical protein
LTVRYNKNTHHSGSFNGGELPEKETRAFGSSLLKKDLPVDKKKDILVLLAHLGTIEAFRQIEKYYNNPGNELRQWTLLALQECKMFFEDSLLDESTGVISTGLGGVDNRLIYYFFVLLLIEHTFSETQKNILKGEFTLVCKNLNSILETVHFSDTCIGLVVLVPLDVAVGTGIETGINKCNESGNFVFEHYYVTNEKIQEFAEIDDIIKLIME